MFEVDYIISQIESLQNKVSEPVANLNILDALSIEQTAVSLPFATELTEISKVMDDLYKSVLKLFQLIPDLIDKINSVSVKGDLNLDLTIDGPHVDKYLKSVFLHSLMNSLRHLIYVMYKNAISVSSMYDCACLTVFGSEVLEKLASCTKLCLGLIELEIFDFKFSAFDKLLSDYACGNLNLQMASLDMKHLYSCFTNLKEVNDFQKIITDQIAGQFKEHVRKMRANTSTVSQTTTSSREASGNILTRNIPKAPYSAAQSNSPLALIERAASLAIKFTRKNVGRLFASGSKPIGVVGSEIIEQNSEDLLYQLSIMQILNILEFIHSASTENEIRKLIDIDKLMNDVDNYDPKKPRGNGSSDMVVRYNKSCKYVFDLLTASECSLKGVPCNPRSVNDDRKYKLYWYHARVNNVTPPDHQKNAMSSPSNEGPYINSIFNPQYSVSIPSANTSSSSSCNSSSSTTDNLNNPKLSKSPPQLLLLAREMISGHYASKNSNQTVLQVIDPQRRNEPARQTNDISSQIIINNFFATVNSLTNNSTIQSAQLDGYSSLTGIGNQKLS